MADAGVTLIRDAGGDRGGASFDGVVVFGDGGEIHFTGIARIERG